MNTKDNNKHNINYASKALDLYFCINRFIYYNHNRNNNMYVIHLNSLEKDRNVFMYKIWKQYRDRIIKDNKKEFFVEMGMGAIEKDHNGYYHIHLILTFKKNFNKKRIYRINSNLRKLWKLLNLKYSGIELNKNRFASDALNSSKESNLTRYLAKAVKHPQKHKGIEAYLPKDFGTKSSFRVSLGGANTIYSKNELPSWKYSDAQILKKLKAVCNEYYNLQNLHLFNEKRPYGFSVTDQDN